MKVKEARLIGNVLAFNLGADKDAQEEAATFLNGFRPGDDLQIRKKRHKRSLSANAYCWQLCGLIGAAKGVTKTAVYRKAIQDGNAYQMMEVEPQNEDRFIEIWNGLGIGWYAEIVARHLHNSDIRCYYGSSVYDVHEMSALIDTLVRWAEKLGIETLSERELSLLKDDWETRRKEDD